VKPVSHRLNVLLRSGGEEGLRRRYARFWANVDMSAGPFGCWLWKGPFNGGPPGKPKYGMFGSYLAHREAWAISHGGIYPDSFPDGRRQFVCHHCDNPPCVNPGPPVPWNGPGQLSRHGPKWSPRLASARVLDGRSLRQPTSGPFAGPGVYRSHEGGPEASQPSLLIGTTVRSGVRLASATSCMAESNSPY
jgi:hypothetical protein